MEVALITESTGAHLGHYLGALRDLPAVDGVHVIDPTGEMEDQMREALGPKLLDFTSDVGSLTKKRLPIAIVTVEALHGPALISKCLESGTHVLAEKPACVTAEDFEALATLASENDRQIVLAFANRSAPLYRDAHQVVAEGNLGRIYGVQCFTIADQARLQRQHDQGAWFAVKNRGGGGHLIWLGIHAIDWIHYICGTAITEVSALAGNVGGVPIDVEDAAVVSFRGLNGMYGTLTSAYYTEGPKQILTTFWGEKGWMWLRPRNENCLVWQTYQDEAQGREPNETRYEGKFNSYQALIEETIRAAAGDGHFPLTTQDSLQAIRTVFAAYESAYTGERVGVLTDGR